MGPFFGILLAALVPVYPFLILRKKFNIYNASALAATYGFVSAVNFVTAISYLELQAVSFEGQVVAVMALMEAPSIIIRVFLLSACQKDKSNVNYGEILKHAFQTVVYCLLSAH
jgi:hypothetical protein